MKEYRKVPSLNFLYEISKDGEIRNVKSKHIIAEVIDKYGYITVSVVEFGKRTPKLQHRLVAECWIKIPEHLKEFEMKDLQVNHIDGNKKNNNSYNLEWCTAKENKAHAINTGLSDMKHLNEYKYQPKKLKCVDLDIEFESSYYAARYLIDEYGVNPNQHTVSRVIRKCCSDKNRKAYGFKWIYIT